MYKTIIFLGLYINLIFGNNILLFFLPLYFLNFRTFSVNWVACLPSLNQHCYVNQTSNAELAISWKINIHLKMDIIYVDIRTWESVSSNQVSTIVLIYCSVFSVVEEEGMGQKDWLGYRSICQLEGLSYQIARKSGAISK